MKLAMIGLGKMGANMAFRLVDAGHEIIGFDLNEEVVLKAAEKGVMPSKSIEELVEKLPEPKILWLMVPAGDPIRKLVETLLEKLKPGDIVIDGGNSYYKDSQARAALLKEKKINYVDVGTSGGVWGLTEGYSLMIGGEKEIVTYLQPIFESLATAHDKGWGHVGPVGSGHFVKMVHNGIEYGLMQAYAEGFELMQHKQVFSLDLHQIAEIWSYGSVIRSWLLDLTSNALSENPRLEGIAAYVPDSGEGRWTVAEAIDLHCAIPVITAALARRFRSREAAPFGDKLLSSLRNQFGGHPIKEE
ncbi:MAG: decarboxylating 6-phosphogluconate dehydrogenase [Anaerolineales bacterium]|nr:decarboxylating 6-phosphogluconate dehydrogenase [Anaerolineales bacterium]